MLIFNYPQVYTRFGHQTVLDNRVREDSWPKEMRYQIVGGSGPDGTACAKFDNLHELLNQNVFLVAEECDFAVRSLITIDLHNLCGVLAKQYVQEPHEKAYKSRTVSRQFETNNTMFSFYFVPNRLNVEHFVFQKGLSRILLRARGMDRRAGHRGKRF